MKLKINKKIEAGIYKVDISVDNFTPKEQLQISKFGSPKILLSPQSIVRPHPFSPITSLPIHSINHSFVFNNEQSADSFVNIMTDRIKTALEELRKKEDNFTEIKEYEL